MDKNILNQNWQNLRDTLPLEAQNIAMEGINLMIHGIDLVSFNISGDKGRNIWETTVLSKEVDSRESQSITMGPGTELHGTDAAGSQGRNGGPNAFEKATGPLSKEAAGVKRQGSGPVIQVVDGSHIIEGTNGQVSKSGPHNFEARAGPQADPIPSNVYTQTCL